MRTYFSNCSSNCNTVATATVSSSCVNSIISIDAVYSASISIIGIIKLLTIRLIAINDN